ncbi:MAG: GcrA family cell cycle regulator [Pikeienuella sp.]
MAWTDDRVEKLKAMWGEGQSASQIAKTLGGVTRNAVIGKVHRLGLSNRATAGKAAAASAAAPAPAPAAAPKPAPETKAAKPAPKPAPAPEPKPKPKAAAPAPTPAPAPVMPPKPIVPSATARREPPPPTPAMVEDQQRTAQALAAMEKKARRIDLLQLTERTCKWPIGDPATEDFFFCGLACAPGKPYCEEHVAVAFQPMSSRRDRDRNRNRGTSR